jgi:hypothetical protein
MVAGERERFLVIAFWVAEAYDPFSTIWKARDTRSQAPCTLTAVFGIFMERAVATNGSFPARTGEFRCAL